MYTYLNITFTLSSIWSDTLNQLFKCNRSTQFVSINRLVQFFRNLGSATDLRFFNFFLLYHVTGRTQPFPLDLSFVISFSKQFAYLKYGYDNILYYHINGHAIIWQWKYYILCSCQLSTRQKQFFFSRKCTLSDHQLYLLSTCYTWEIKPNFFFQT